MALANPAAVVVSNVAVLVLAANPKRIYACIQQTTANPVRLGSSTVTAVTGISLAQRDKLVLEGGKKEVYTGEVWAIREGGADGSVNVIEVTKS